MNIKYSAPFVTDLIQLEIFAPNFKVFGY